MATDLNHKLKNIPLLWRFAPSSHKPVNWVGYGPITEWLGAYFSTKTPPTLILSLPRSGSSWVGDVLGHANDSMYLREPITQSNMQERHANSAIVTSSINEDDPFLTEYARRAFHGIPDFIPGIVNNSDQWQLAARSHNRVIIKEVNPLAIDWLLTKYKPRVIFLVRHPISVASSFKRLGWTSSHLSDVRQSLEQEDDTPMHWNTVARGSNDFWEDNILMQGGCLYYAWNKLRHYPDKKIVMYEELCLDPINIFRDLFQFAGISWDTHIEQLIIEKTKGGNKSDPYSTSRKSSIMADISSSHLTQPEILKLRNFFMPYELPWYQTHDDWKC